MSLYLYMGGSLSYYFETDNDNFGPNNYISVLYISPAYMRKSIHSAVRIASLNSLCLHAINNASMYALSIKLLRM